MRLCLVLVVALWSLAAARARADTYEWQRTERLLQRSGLELVEAPEGKRIAWIRIVRDDVFVEDEIWPTWFNWFHGRTREPIVQRELLFHEGDPFQVARSEETMRNLRGMAIFALVRIVPVRVEDPDAVGVVVHTRDLWSLRLETDFNVTTIVDEFKLRLAERNFLGRNKLVAGDFTLYPKSYWFQQEFFARRVWSSSVTLEESAGVVFNRETNRAEGSVWLLELGQPFYNLRQRYGWLLNFSYYDYVARSLRANKYATYPKTPAPDAVVGVDYANLVYRRRRLLASLMGYVRLGERFKQTWGAGWDVRALTARANAETHLPAQLERGFEAEVLPFQRTEIGPAFTYEILMPVYQRFENLATYGQSENVRLGPHAKLSARAPRSAFGSTPASWVFSAEAGFVLAPGGFLVEARASGRTRYERDALVDQLLEGLFRAATPVLFRAFRVVTRAFVEARRNDTQKTYVTLGASNGLRGYTSQAFGLLGGSRFLANFELRTLPIEWQAVHIGAVLFYDVGSVYRTLSAIVPHHAVGLGLRVLFPQFNREVFSLDGGTSYDPSFRFVPTISSGQVVPMTAAEDPEE